MNDLASAAATLVGPGKGILAANESIGTISARLAAAGVPATVANRRAYREMLVTTPGLAGGISGVILSGETFRQRLRDGRPFPAALAGLGMMAGVRADAGCRPLAGTQGETVTEGLDGLPTALAGVAFSSGGQHPECATGNLAAMQHALRLWPLTFAFGRALGAPALAAWRGQPGRVGAGQHALARRVAMNVAAVEGRYRAGVAK
jgi:fructose-bisphosphate aldolase class 1